MPVEVVIDDARLQKAFRKFPKLLARNMRKAFTVYSGAYLPDYTRTRMRVPDDRQASDAPLFRRPRGSLGLVARSGGLNRSLTSKIEGTDINSLTLRFGFFSAFSARIARVHELGTQGAGGTLPDIRPVRAKFLRVPVRQIGAALSSNITSIVNLRRVAIPPRLEFKKTFFAPKSQSMIRTAVKRAVDFTIQGKAP